MSRRLENAIRLFDRSKADTSERIAGLLGITTGGEQVVEIPDRPGYVWVRLRANVNEIIQAFNETTSPVYGLPVFVERDPLNANRYRVISRDVGLYSDWGTASPFLASHAITHSFVEGGGADVTWVYGRQFMPGNVAPSGTSGAGNVIVHPYPYFFNNMWHYAGGTGSSDLLASKPSGANAKVVLIYIDATDGNPKLIEGSEFDSSITGTAAIIPYVPTLGDATTQIPLAAVRLVSGTSAINWRNIYDLKPYYSVSASGTAGGAGSSGLIYVSGDDTTLGYLENKLIAGTGISLSVNNPGGNETITITNTGDSGPTGTNTFLGLSDTPASYAGQALRAVQVNATQDALEFADFPTGPTGTVKVSANDTTDDFLENKLSAGTNITLSIVNEGGDEQVRITSSGGGGGATTTFSGARRYRISPATGTASSWFEIDFDDAVGAEEYDTDNYFPTGTAGAAYFEAPESGYYRMVGQVYSESAPTGTYVKLGLWLNNTADLIAECTHGYPDNTNQERTWIVSTDYYLEAGDDVRLRVFTEDDITFATGTSRTYLQIGKLEPPSNFSGVRLYRDSTQTINNATGTAVQWTDEKYDTDDYFTSGASTTRVDYTTAGYYNITAQVEWEQNNTGYRWVYLLLNGTDIIAESTDVPAPSSDQAILVSTDWLMAEDDYVELWVWQNSGGNTTIRGQDPSGETDGSETYLVSHYLGAS